MCGFWFRKLSFSVSIHVSLQFNGSSLYCDFIVFNESKKSWCFISFLSLLFVASIDGNSWSSLHAGQETRNMSIRLSFLKTYVKLTGRSFPDISSKEMGMGKKDLPAGYRNKLTGTLGSNSELQEQEEEKRVEEKERKL